MVNRIYSTTHTNSNDKPNNYPLWVIHAVADPGCILIPSLAFLLHPHMWKNVLACQGWSKNAESTCNTKYSVPLAPQGMTSKKFFAGYTVLSILLHPSIVTRCLYEAPKSRNFVQCHVYHKLKRKGHNIKTSNSTLIISCV